MISACYSSWGFSLDLRIPCPPHRVPSLLETTSMLSCRMDSPLTWCIRSHFSMVERCLPRAMVA
jgi:hypothetical protein